MRNHDCPHDQAEVLARTTRWLERAVIGLNLCPFAKAVHAKGRIRYVVSNARSEHALLAELGQELLRLRDSAPEQIDTTLLIHPQALRDFPSYNDFLDLADGLLEQLGLSGTVQIASFHPHYRFAGTTADDIVNFTNRAPEPMLHLLRESSVARATAAYPDPDAITARNQRRLRALGLAGWQRLFDSPQR